MITSHIYPRVSLRVTLSASVGAWLMHPLPGLVGIVPVRAATGRDPVSLLFSGRPLLDVGRSCMTQNMRFSLGRYKHHLRCG